MITLLLAAAIAATPLAEYEVAYWDCDYASTIGLISMSDAAQCSAVFEKLKAEKFGGDFKKFMVWWQANKVAEHTKRKK